MEYLPYSCQLIEEDDVAAVTAALKAPIISQGAYLQTFEIAFAAYVHAEEAIAFSSGTAALHAICAVAGIGPGDEVIIPALTFASTANVILHVQGTPVFADIDPETRTLSAEAVKRHLTPQTKAIIAVDFAGMPCDYHALQTLAADHDIMLLADAAHAVGATYKKKSIGSIAEMSAFSFGPVKNMTTAEGGMVTTNQPELARLLRQFRLHGMTRDSAYLKHPTPAAWYYEQQTLGLNYKMTELAAALGSSQLKKLERYNKKRADLATFYTDALAALPLKLPSAGRGCVSAWHLYVVELLTPPPYDRDVCFRFLRSKGIGVQVHYIPVPLHPYYQSLGYDIELCPHAVAYANRALSLPLHPRMSIMDAQRVVDSLHTFFSR